MNLSLPSLNFIIKVGLTMAIISVALRFLPSSISSTVKGTIYA